MGWSQLASAARGVRLQPLLQWDPVRAWLVPLLACVLSVLVLCEILQVRARWGVRKIPGPFGWPILGNLLSIQSEGLNQYIDKCGKTYGSIFKIWVGPSPWVVTTDPAIAKVFNNKLINRAEIPSVLNDKHGLGENSFGLAAARVYSFICLFARDDMWRVLRLAWQPAFRSSSLEQYAPLMSSSAIRLSNKLKKSADSGEYVDIWRELGKMTMDVVGSSAYGVNFRTLEEYEDKQASQLIHGVKVLFENGLVSFTSPYQAAMIVFPSLVPFIRRLSWWVPDAQLKRTREPCRIVRDQSYDLIRSWRSAHKKADDVTAETTMSKENGENNGFEPTSKADKCPFVGRNAPGNFLGLIMGAKDSATDKQLTDGVIAAQANTFILAGYETTASTLAFAIYCLSTNKGAEAKVLEEVDAFFATGKEDISVQDVDEQFPYVESVIKEAQRVYPPVAQLSRETKERTTVGPYSVPQGTILVTAVWSMHHDADIWPDASSFRPERFLPGHAELAPRVPHAHLPFGSGPRVCIGMRFAVQEAKLALIHLYRRYTFELKEGVAPLRTVTKVTMSPEGGVPVRIISRAPSS